MTSSPEEVVVSPVGDERVVTGSGFTEKPFQGKMCYSLEDSQHLA